MAMQVDDKIYEKLYDYIEDAHALEQAAVDSVGSMIDSLHGTELQALLERQRQVSRLHAERLSHRLDTLGRDASVRKRIEGLAMTLMKSVSDAVRTDAPGKVGRDTYLLAHAQIAAYELLRRLAEHAGDNETADIARTNLDEDRQLAAEVVEHWDSFLRLTVAGWREPAAAARQASSNDFV
jgi:ferritin-like metal-binding protein YciE